MRRRAFITLLGGAAAAWPHAARAQQAAKLPIIGYIGAGTPSASRRWVAAFVQRLRELGWIEGRTVAIEYRWAEGQIERFSEIAAEFVRLKVDVIFATGAGAAVAKEATSVIPIVFTLAQDPIGSGLVASLARPGATSPAYRTSRPILPASGSNFYAMLSPVSADWRSWPMLAMRAPRSIWARLKPQPASSAFRSLHQQSGGRRHHTCLRCD